MSQSKRRDFIGTALTAMAVAVTGDARKLAAVPRQTVDSSKKYRIDVHHHFGPPAWVAAMKGNKLLQPANTTWTPEKSIAELDRGGGAAAILSITNPGIYLGDQQQTVRLARDCNEFGAKVVHDHPARFGLFAIMPLPDVEGTLKEIAYVYDQLHADGVGFMTSFGDTWLGNAAYKPVFEELHRRNAVVFVHPTAADCCRSLDYGAAPASIEYGTDTTRAITSVCYSGFTAQFNNIRWIWSQGGGSMPFLAGRVSGGANNRTQEMPNGMMAELRKMYYDLAGAANPGVVASLRQLVTPDKILLGTDFPPGGHLLEQAQAIRDIKMFSDTELRMIERDNALKLFPRLAALA